MEDNKEAKEQEQEIEEPHTYICGECTSFCTWSIRQVCKSDGYRYFKK